MYLYAAWGIYIIYVKKNKKMRENWNNNRLMLNGRVKEAEEAQSIAEEALEKAEESLDSNSNDNKDEGK